MTAIKKKSNPAIKSEKDKTPGQTPEHNQPAKEKTGYPHETEFLHPQEGNDASFSEQTDVTPPTKRELVPLKPTL
jgi:hypothetical protein